MNYSRVLSVTQVNTYIKSIIEGDKNLSRVMIKGEISNFKNQYSSGHFYFTLKDSQSSIKAVMFKANAMSIKFMPENGMSVTVGGEVSVYEKEGQYQIYCTDMLPTGIGGLALAYEQLKARLGAEGLFDVEHKKPLPRFPARIAVITSQTGAAVQDIISVLSRRYPVVEVILCHVTVQGEDAPRMITNTLHKISEFTNVDLIILARGGGSYEDLIPFNDEAVARAIYECTIPVISAIGHETDFTIADFVADLRAPTPSAAAELAVPDISELQSRIFEYQRLLQFTCHKRLLSVSERLQALIDDFTSVSPIEALHNNERVLNGYAARLLAAVDGNVKTKKDSVAMYLGILDALSPLKVLNRGYSVTYIGDNIIKSYQEVQKEDKITIRLQDGIINAQVV